MSIPTISDIASIVTEPELRYTQSGKAILSFRAAFNDSKFNDQTQKWDTTKSFYVDAQAWEQTAERLAEQLAKGDQVYLSGRLETQQWEKDGEKKSKAVLNIQAVRKLAKAGVGGQGQQRQSVAAGVPQQDPWATPGVSNGGGWGSGPDSEPPF